MALAKLNPLEKIKTKLMTLYAAHEQEQKARVALHVKYAKVFDKEREHTSRIEEIQEGIKALVRKFYEGKPSGAYEDFRGDFYTVKVTAKYSTEIDADGLLAAVPQLRAIPGVVVTSIDRAKIKALVETGQIDPETVARFTTTKQSTSAVSFAPTEG